VLVTGGAGFISSNVIRRLLDRHLGSTEQARRLLGWEARTPFEEGLARAVVWYRENEARWRGVRRRALSVSSF